MNKVVEVVLKHLIEGVRAMLKIIISQALLKGEHKWKI